MGVSSAHSMEMIQSYGVDGIGWVAEIGTDFPMGGTIDMEQDMKPWRKVWHKTRIPSKKHRVKIWDK